MDVTEIIGDAIVYPAKNIRSLIIYVIIGIVTALLGGLSLLGMMASASGNNVLAAGGLGFIGILILFCWLMMVRFVCKYVCS